MLFPGQRFSIFNERLKQVADLQSYDKKANYSMWLNGRYFIQLADKTAYEGNTPLFYHANLLYGMPLFPKKYQQLVLLTAKTSYFKVIENRSNLRCLIQGKFVRKMVNFGKKFSSGSFEVKEGVDFTTFKKISFKSSRLNIYSNIDKNDTYLIEVDFERNLHNIFYNCSTGTMVTSPSWIPRD